MIEANVIDAAFRNGVKKLLFLGSSCIYPKLAKQPISEDALLTGALEPTPDLTSLVQEIVDRAAWSSGNAMAFIIAGSGQRTAISVDLNSDHEPRLVITYALT